MELTEKQDKLVNKVKTKIPEFYEDVERLSTAEMEDRIVRYISEMTEAQSALERNAPYQMLKEQLKEIEGPINDVKKTIDMKIKYLLIAIEEKGGSPNTSSHLYRMATKSL